MIRTTAPQQGHMAAAGARMCVLGGDAWNAAVAVTVGSFRTRSAHATKRPARHLGVSTT